MSVPYLARALAARGYLPDTAGTGRYGMVEQSLRFLGTYLVIVKHEAYPANPYSWDPRDRVRLTAIEVRHGKRLIPSEALPLPVFSEIAAELTAL